MTVIQERADLLPMIHLKAGAHPTADQGMCAEEAVAWLAGLDHTDFPKCASPVLAVYCRQLNDQWDDEQRQKLKPYLIPQIGTVGDGQDHARSMIALDWLIHIYTPAWLDLAGCTAEAQSLRDHPRIAGLAAATSVGPLVRNAQQKAAAAWAAAWDATRDAAGDAAGDAAWDATRDAAGDAAGDAAWAAARTAARAAAWAATRDVAWAAARAAARAATRDAARTAARDAARDALRPTVETLQVSALDLLNRMIDPSAVAEVTHA